MDIVVVENVRKIYRRNKYLFAIIINNEIQKIVNFYSTNQPVVTQICLSNE